MRTSERLKPLIGQVFERLTVIEVYMREPGQPGATALCRCKCGTERVFSIHALRQRTAVSCGCLRLERMCGNTLRLKHGESRHRTSVRSVEYRTWLDMHWRCNPKSKAHQKWYAGVTVCERWKKFENFLEDMGRRPSPYHSLDRKDNDNGYSKDNCRWATARQQVLNRTNAVYVYLDGKLIPMIYAAEILGVTYHQLYMRTQPLELA